MHACRHASQCKPSVPYLSPIGFLPPCLPRPSARAAGAGALRGAAPVSAQGLDHGAVGRGLLHHGHRGCAAGSGVGKDRVRARVGLGSGRMSCCLCCFPGKSLRLARLYETLVAAIQRLVVAVGVCDGIVVLAALTRRQSGGELAPCSRSGLVGSRGRQQRGEQPGGDEQRRALQPAELQGVRGAALRVDPQKVARGAARHTPVLLCPPNIPSALSPPGPAWICPDWSSCYAEC